MRPVRVFWVSPAPSVFSSKYINIVARALAVGGTPHGSCISVWRTTTTGHVAMPSHGCCMGERWLVRLWCGFRGVSWLCTWRVNYARRTEDKRPRSAASSDVVCRRQREGPEESETGGTLSITGLLLPTPLHQESLALPLHCEAGIDRGERLHLLCQHVSLPFELPDFGVHGPHITWDVHRACQVVFVLEGTVLDIDFSLHMVQLLFRLGEFGRRGLPAPLERGFGNAPLLILLDEPRRLAVQSLDIPGERGVVLARLLLRLPGTGEQRLDVLFLPGIGGAFTRDVGAPRIPCPGPNNATDPGANGGPTSTSNECADPRPDRGSCPGSDQGALRGRALRV
jgi:hypothetical protein